MDPVGTVRREDFDEGGYAIWVRQSPGYPDDQYLDTEWTCVWSTAVGCIGGRRGGGVATVSKVIGYVPGTPALTGDDVRLNDTVSVPGIMLALDEPTLGTVVRIGPPPGKTFLAPLGVPVFSIQLDATWAHAPVILPRYQFDLVEKDS